MLGVSLALTLLVIAGWAVGVLRTYEQSSVDTRFALRGVEQTSGSKQMVVVGIDDKTFNDLNEQWPFPRDMHAALIDQLSEAGARTIGMDIQFTEPSDDPAADEELIAAVGRAGNVVLATEETDDGRTRVFGGDEVVESVDATVGHSQVVQDFGGVVRRFSAETGGIPTLPVAIAERATGTTPEPDEFRNDGTAWIDFVGPTESIKTVSYSDVLNGKVPASEIDGKVVVVGATAPSLQDRHRSSTSGSSLMPGVEIVANASATILSGFPPLTEAGWFLTLLLVLAFGVALPVLSRRLDPMVAFGISFLILVVYLGIAYLVFLNGYILPVVYPIAALVLTSIAALAINLLTESYERARTREVFARFAPDSVVDQVLEGDGSHVELGGKRVEATLLFSDLRGFTTFSEKRDPEEVISILNDYLTEMSDAILDNGGTLVSFMGDGIMAVFGAPIESNDHADRAFNAAQDMLARLKQFNQRMVDEDPKNKPFKMGIGVNTGWVMSGNVGSERRLEYTAIGDTTNTSARLEGATKGTPYQLFVADSTYQRLAHKPEELEFVEELPIRGRETGVRVWGL